MARKYHNLVIEPTTGSNPGAPVASAEVTVRAKEDNSIATVYSDSALTAAITQPILTDAGGRFAFYAKDGRYNLDVFKSGVVNFTIADVSIADPDRITEVVLNDDFWVVMNARFNRVSGQWERADTAKIARAIVLEGAALDRVRFLRVAAGANPITWVQIGGPTFDVRFTVQGVAQVFNKIAQLLVGGPARYTKLRAFADVAPTGADLNIRINKNGVSAATLSIPAGTQSASSTPGTPIEVVEGDRVSLDITQVGSAVAGGDDLLVVLYAN